MSLKEGSVWPKLLASFAGGIVCMSLLPEIGGTAPAPIRTQAGLAKTVSAESREPPKAAPAAESVPAIPDRAAQAICASQVWPHVSPECAGTERGDSAPTRDVRVIPTDRTGSLPTSSQTPLAAPDKPRAAAAAPRKSAPPVKANRDTASLPPETVEDAGAPLAPSPTAPAAAASPPPAAAEAPAKIAMPAIPMVAGTPSSPERLEVKADDRSVGGSTPPADAAAVAVPPAPAAAPITKAKPRARVRSAAPAERGDARSRTMRRLAERDEYPDGLVAMRLRTVRLADGRLVTVRVRPNESRSRRYLDEADLPPPPPYARYRRGRDSVMTWLDSPGY